jgi:hypothetical protein
LTILETDPTAYGLIYVAPPTSTQAIPVIATTTATSIAAATVTSTGELSIVASSSNGSGLSSSTGLVTPAVVSGVSSVGSGPSSGLLASSFQSSSTASGSLVNATSGGPETVSSSPGLSTAAKAGIGVGTPLGIALIGLLGVLFYRRRQRTVDEITSEDGSGSPYATGMGIPNAPVPGVDGLVGASRATIRPVPRTSDGIYNGSTASPQALSSHPVTEYRNAVPEPHQNSTPTIVPQGPNLRLPVSHSSRFSP